MSEMGPEDAEGGNSETYTQVYNVETDEGVQALNLLTSSTQAYAAAADNTLGKIAKGSQRVTELGQNLTGLRKTNNAATSEAARYQQALSGLEATVKTSTKGTKNFNAEWSAMQKTTKQLARDMPIGIGGAIAQVDELQKSGIKSQAVIKSLAKTYTELGAANAESGPALGRDMTALSRIYGATDKQISGIADSLTTVTQKLGGSASGTLSFAKQIAPIASTVGISEAKVIGLSNAFSKMGEDGSGAATAVNRVLLDLNKSIRTGSPEIATYARLLGTSSDNLQKLFQSQPDEVLVQFFEKIAKSGPDAITVLDQLGLDGVRTSRSIQALARSGGLRESIETSVAGYNSGATSEGAKVAYGGVNDQLAKLQETTRQTVEATGRPYLRFLGLSAAIANKVAGATNTVLNSTVAQAGQTVGGAGLFAGHAAMTAMGGLATYALGKNLYRGGRAIYQDFQGGRAFAAGVPGATEPLNRVTGMPSLAGRAGMEAANVIGAPRGPGGMPTVRGMLSAPVRGLLNTGSIYGDMLRADAQQANSPDRVRPQTRYGVASQALRTELKMNKAIEDSTARHVANTAALKKFASSTVAAEGGLKAVTKSYVGAAAAQARLGATDAAKLAGRGLAAGAGMLAGPGGIAVAGIGGVMFANAQAEQAKRQREVAKQGVVDPFGQYNNFAAAVGIAGRSASGFTDAADRSIQVLLEGNKTIADASKLTDKEYRQSLGAQTPIGFELSEQEKGKQGFWKRNFGGDNQADDSQAIAMRISGMMGPKLDKDALTLIAQNLGQQGMSQPRVQEVLDQVTQGYNAQGTGGASYKDMIAAAIDAQGNKIFEGIGGLDSSASPLVAGAGSMAQQKADQVADIYGEDAGTAARYAEQGKLIAAANAAAAEALKGDTWKDWGPGHNKGFVRADEVRKQTLRDSATALGFSEGDFLDAAGSAGKSGRSAKSLPDIIKTLQGTKKGDLDEDTIATLAKYADFTSRGFDIADSESFKKFVGGTTGRSTTVAEQSALRRNLEGAGQPGGSAASDAVTKGLYEATDAMIATGKTVDKLPAAMVDGFSKIGKAAFDLDQNPQGKSTTELTRNLAAALVRGQQKGGADAGTALAQLQSYANTVQDPKQQQAIALAQRMQQRQAVAEDAGDGSLAKLMAGISRTTAMTQLPQTPANEEIIQGAKDQLVNQKAAFQDQAKQMAISYRETAISMKEARKDLNISLTQMQEDYQLQTSASAESHNRQMFQVERDYNAQMKYMEADYFRSRSYALEDFNRQREYAIKDSAKTLINPYERIGAGNVLTAGGLTNNLKDQVQVLRQQMGNIKKLKELGLSQDAIDVLDLYNPANAFQVQRLVMDLQNSRRGAARLNRVVAQKMKIGGEITTSTEEFRRSEKELQISLDRMAEQYNTARERAQVAHANALADANAAYQQSLDLAAEQQRRAQERMTEGLERSQRRQRRAMTRSIQDLTDQGKGATKEFKALFDSYQGILGTDVAGALSDVITKYNSVTSQLPKMAKAEITINYDNFHAMAATGGQPEAAPPPSRQSPTAVDAEAEGYKKVGRGHHDKAGHGYPGASGRTTGGYVDPVDLQESMTGSRGHTVHVDQSQHHDYSTNVTGPITVQAQDPHEMAHKLAAEAARKRLVNPVSG